MTGATLFSGILAPEVALPEIEWKWCAEVEPFCCSLIKERYPELPNLGDVTDGGFIERARAGGPLDLIVAGSPCQAFSVAGLRGSLEDSRGNLTLRLVEIIHAIKPRYLLWENVPGVLSTHDNAFGCFLAGLVGADEALDPGEGWTDAGVADGRLGRAAWRILDAQYFGLAQRRERVFVVAGFGDGAHPAEILFEWESLRRDFAPGREAGQGAAGTLAQSLTASGRSVERAGESRGQDPVVAMCLNGGGMGRIDAESETFVVAHTLRAEHDGSEDGTGRGVPLVTHALSNMGRHVTEDGTGRGVPLVPWMHQGLRVQDADDVAYTLKDNHAGGTRINPVLAPLMPETADPISAHEQRTYSHKGGHNFRLRNVVPNGMAVRRLTPTECERLQGFPDGYTLVPYRGKPAADGPRYKALGNSFAVPVIRWIGRRIQEKL